MPQNDDMPGMNHESAGSAGAGRQQDDPDTTGPAGPSLDSADILRQVRAAIAGSDGRLEEMTRKSVERADIRASEAANLARRVPTDEARAAARAARQDARDEVKQARELGDLHRTVLSYLSDDLERLMAGFRSGAPDESEAKPAQTTAEAAPEQGSGGTRRT